MNEGTECLHRLCHLLATGTIVTDAIGAGAPCVTALHRTTTVITVDDAPPRLPAAGCRLGRLHHPLAAAPPLAPLHPHLHASADASNRARPPRRLATSVQVRWNRHPGVSAASQSRPRRILPSLLRLATDGTGCGHHRDRCRGRGLPCDVTVRPPRWPGEEACPARDRALLTGTLAAAIVLRPATVIHPCLSARAPAVTELLTHKLEF